jgi:hypothetical protein
MGKLNKKELRAIVLKLPRVEVFLERRREWW